MKGRIVRFKWEERGRRGRRKIWREREKMDGWAISGMNGSDDARM